jgi:peroxin-2
MAEVLRDAWDKAQPKLAAIRSSLDPRSFPKPQIARVGKLDAELLDQELVQLLREPLSKAVALVNVSLHYYMVPGLCFTHSYY